MCLLYTHFPTFVGFTLELASIMSVYLEPTLNVKELKMYLLQLYLVIMETKPKFAAKYSLHYIDQ